MADKGIDISGLISDFKARQSDDSGASEAGGTVSGASFEKWIGAHEFIELIEECKRIAPVLIESKTEEVFISRQYLFSINEGYGFSTSLKTLAETLSDLGLFKCGDDKTIEVTLKMSSDSRDSGADFIRVLETVEKASKRKLICGIDISEWLPKVNDIEFIYFLKVLNEYVGKTIFVFRVPFLEKVALDNVKRSIGDIFTVKNVSFVPYTTEELIKTAENILEEKSFTLNEDARSMIIARISEEKSDGRYYGIHTMRKVVREMIYLKQLANIEAPEYSTDICCKDILKLSESYDANEKTGIEQLDDMIGLDKIKNSIKEIVSTIEMARKTGNLSPPCIHMRFTGNPGTGKTTVARVIGKILHEKGILRNGNFFEYNGRDFCGRYVGETAPKTAAMCRDAYGSVLFIDEAYSLYSGNDRSVDYGREVLSTLVSEMENHRDDLLVIMAGYTDEMDTLMKGNAGLASRMPYSIEFPNYTRDELYDIFMIMASRNFTFDDDFKTAVKEYFDSISNDLLDSKEFSNARFVRNLFERTWGKAVLREQLDNDISMTLSLEDFMQASTDSEFKQIQEKKARKIGFATT